MTADSLNSPTLKVGSTVSKQLRRIIATMAVVLGMAFVPVPASAQQESSAHVVNLGDSFASAVGAGNYRQGTEGTCYRSIYSAAEQVVAQLKTAGYDVDFTNVACSGARIDDLRQPYHNAVQLGALRPSTRLVFLTVGGNDIGIGGYVQQCLYGDCAGTATRTAMSKLPATGLNLTRLLQEIQTRSPEARIVLMGYGQPVASGANAPGMPGVDLDPICAPEYLSLEERRSGARLTAALDLTLRMAAETAKYRGLDVTYITPYASSVPWNIRIDQEFEGDSVCDTTLTRQIYHGFSAMFPQPEGDAAGATAVLHGAHRTDDISFYGRMARKVIREAPSLAALVS